MPRALIFGIIGALLSGSISAQTPAVSQPTGIIRGRVINVATGVPLSKTIVTLGKYMSGEIGRKTTTAADGNFEFDNVPAGSYGLTAQRPLFVPHVVGQMLPGTAGSALAIGPGERITDIVIKLSPQGLIAGRVLSLDGLALPRAQLFLWRDGFTEGRRFAYRFDERASDIDGSFLIGRLSAGRYYLCAGQQNSFDRRVLEKLTGEGDQMICYPRASRLADAMPIDLQAGGEVRNIELRLPRKRLAQISGTIRLASGEADELVANLWLETTGPAGRRVAVQFAEATLTEPTFEFQTVPPGDYVLHAGTQVNTLEDPKRWTARRSFKVTDDDIVDLDIALDVTIPISGTIRVENNDSVAFPTEFRALFASSDRPFHGNSVGFVKNGTFESSVERGDYQIYAWDDELKFFTKQVKLDGRDVTNQVVNITSPGKVEIVISLHPGAITGVVRDSQGKSAAGAVVALWGRGSAPFVTNTVTDAAGRFHLKKLPPGEFRIAAWEGLEYGAVEAPAFLAAFETTAVSIEVSEDSVKTVTLTAISAARTHSEVAKLR